MHRPGLLSFTLAAILGAGTLQAQSRVHPGDGALSSAEVASASSGSATVAIMTLAWTDIRVPVRLLAPSSPAAAPSARSRQFVLTWQEPTAGAPATGSLAIDSPPCTVMRLVMVRCE